MQRRGLGVKKTLKRGLRGIQITKLYILGASGGLKGLNPNDSLLMSFRIGLNPFIFVVFGIFLIKAAIEGT